MPEEQKQRENVKSREVVPRDHQRAEGGRQLSDKEKRPKGAPAGGNQQQPGRSQKRRRNQRSAKAAAAQGEWSERQGPPQPKRKTPKKPRTPGTPQKEPALKEKDDGRGRKTLRDIDRPKRIVQDDFRNKQADETEPAEKPVSASHTEGRDNDLRAVARPRRPHKKRLREDEMISAETVDDIRRDFKRIEKDIQIDIDSIRNLKLDL